MEYPDWELGIFKHWSMALILGLPVLLAVVSGAAYVWTACSAKRKNRRRRSELGRNEYNRKASLRHSIVEGLRIDTSSLDVKAILQQKQKLLHSQQHSEDNDPNQARGGGDKNIQDRSNAMFKIHPSSNITEQDIRNVYNGSILQSLRGDPDENANKIVLFYRMASIFASAGMSTIENEEYLHKCCKALGLPPLSLLTLGINEITVQLGLGPVVNISCSTADFYQLSLLSRTQQLAQIIIDQGKDDAEEAEILEGSAAAEENKDKENNAVHPRIYLETLDEMEHTNAAEPYGWIIRLIAVYLVCTFAPVVVYGGNYKNLAAAAIISVFITAEVFAFKCFCPTAFGTWEVPLVSFTTGLLSPILWQSFDENRFSVDACNANANIGVLLIWFPGSTLVYGAYEVFLGSFVNGAARLVKGILSALVIALFYTIGWQYWGQNWWVDWFNIDMEFHLLNQTQVEGAETTMGPLASLPPSIDCLFQSHALPWYMGSVVYAIPFNLSSMIIFNIRCRDLLGAFLVAQATYCVAGALTQCQEDTCKLPYYVTVMLVAFSGGCFAEINELVTGFSKYGSMLAIIFVLAPGAGAVRAVLGAFRRREGDFQGNDNTLWESVVFEGTTYAMGFYLAFSFFRPLRSFRLRF